MGVHGTDLIVRCEKDETAQLLEKKGVRVFDLSGGRPMKGWLLVGPEAAKTPAGFKSWIDFALASTPKAKRASKSAKKAANPKPRSVARRG